MTGTNKGELHNDHIPTEGRTGRESAESRYPVTMAGGSSLATILRAMVKDSVAMHLPQQG